MARGWESKSVEAQQQEAAENVAKAGPPMTAEQAVRRREEQGLGLARNRVLQQLRSNLNPRHRKLLEEELAALDRKLSRFEVPPA